MVSKRVADRFARKTRVVRRGFHSGVVTRREYDQLRRLNFYLQTQRLKEPFKPIYPKIVIVGRGRKS